MLRLRLLYLAAALCGGIAALSSVHANEGPEDRTREHAGPKTSPHGWQTIELDELPEPPPELRGVLARGEITFLVGGERPSVVDPDRSTAAKQGTFAAETRYHLSYSFKSHCRWQWAESPAAKRLQFTVRFDQLRLQAQHRVWFRELPERASFWDSPLVHHELDHVRLSSDPRLTARFIKAVSEHTEVELTRQESAPLIALARRRLSATGENSRAARHRSKSILNSLNGDDAQPLLGSLVQAEFDRIVQLVEIRYQELDRLTDHGRQLVPQESPVLEWLGR